MSSFIVQSVKSVSTFFSQFGKEVDPNTGQKIMYRADMAGLLDGQIEPNATINAMYLSSLPQEGQTIEVTYVREGSFAKLKKVQGQASPPPSIAPSIPAQNAPQPALPPQPTPSYPPREDPLARQGSIERQHSLTAAIAYLTAKTAHMTKEKAVDEFTGEHIVQIARYFHKYTSGKLVEKAPEPLPEYQPEDEF